MGLAPYGEKINQKLYNFPYKYDGIITDYSDFCEEGNYNIKQIHKKPETFEDKARAAYEVQEECEKLFYISHTMQKQQEKTNFVFLEEWD